MQSDLRASARRSWPLAAIALLTASLNLPACVNKPTPAPQLAAPYESRQLWAVVPPRNESGFSGIDTAKVADALAQQTQQVTGIDCLPVNRVIAAMRHLEMSSVSTPAQARTLMNTLDVDGLLVGTITAWDPYKPPAIGMAVQLHVRNDSHRAALDAWQLTRAMGEDASPGAMDHGQAFAQAAGIFDARHARTQQQLAEYAVVRSEDDSAFGAGIHQVSMELYTQFVSYRLIHDLLISEQQRLSQVAQVSPPR